MIVHAIAIHWMVPHMLHTSRAERIEDKGEFLPPRDSKVSRRSRQGNRKFAQHFKISRRFQHFFLANLKFPAHGHWSQFGNDRIVASSGG